MELWKIAKYLEYGTTHNAAVRMPPRPLFRPVAHEIEKAVDTLVQMFKAGSRDPVVVAQAVWP